MIMTARLLAVLASGILLASPARAAVSPADFAARAAAANLFETQSSELALRRSQDGDVKELARIVLADHQKAQHDLTTAAQTGQPVPLQAALDPDHQARLKALKAQPDRKFDKAYLNLQTQAHAETIALFSEYAANGAPGALKTFAVATLPTLQAHMQHVQDFTIPRH